jgi:alpha-amylase/alpha-mannosidase (GH57 family)
LKKTFLTFLWHMHQPDYGIPGQRRNLLPWVRLHATKAYLDLPWLLEQHPHVHAAVNLSGSLLRQLAAYLYDDLRDLWWDLTLRHPSTLSTDERRWLLTNFFSIHWDRHVRPNPHYRALLDKRGDDPAQLRPDRFRDQELLDLQVHFNLAWTGFAARHDSPLLQDLFARGANFSQEDKEALLQEQLRLMSLLLPRYRDLEARGQIELTTTPLYHPILPLLVDSDVARRCQPDRPLPRRFAWPQDASWHIHAALQQHAQHLGAAPAGVWPAEGSLSPEVIPLFAQAGVRWLATDEDTILRSHPRPDAREDALYRPYHLDTAHGPVQILFRDHTLSDLIGFTYATADPALAASDLLGRVAQGGQRATQTAAPLVSLILDGENPWESYPGDGEPFQRALYAALAGRDDIETIRPSDYLARFGAPDRLDHLHSGSWIMGNYQIWIGAEETNTAWNLLGEARQAVEDAARAGLAPEDHQRAMAAIYAAEGSDWFWWYGDDFTSVNDAEFDSLFRGYLREAWRALGQAAPPRLSEPIGRSGPPPALIEHPRNFIQPEINGRAGKFFEWSGAGRYEPTGGAGAMFRAHAYIEALHLGFDLHELYLRLDPGPDWSSDRAQTLELCFDLWRAQSPEGEHQRVHLSPATTSSPSLWRCPPGAPPERAEAPLRAAFEEVLELALPFSALGLSPGDHCQLQVVIHRDGVELDRQPPRPFDWTVPDATFERRHWLV